MLFLPEPLEIKFILSEVATQYRELLGKIEVFDTIDSTNTYLLQKIKEKNIPSGSVCLADQQTHGRGRLGRNWVSPPGANIYCSIFWRFTHLQHEVTGLSIAIAVMVANVLQQYGIKSGIQLKWPNDILFSGKKLGGILLETNSSQSMVIGVGLNLYFPEASADPLLAQAIFLYDITKKNPKRNKLIGLLLNEMIKQLPVFEKEGLAAFRADWEKYDALTGKMITVHAGEQQIMGKMLGINNQGELLLQDDAGSVQQFRCGEVSVRDVKNTPF